MKGRSVTWLVGAVAAAMLSIALVPFSPLVVGLAALRWSSTLGEPWRERARPTLAIFCVASPVSEAIYGHDFLREFLNVWFDNLMAGIVVPGAAAIVLWMTVLLVRDQCLEFREWRVRRVAARGASQAIVIAPDAPEP